MSLFSALQSAVSGTDRFSRETNVISKNLSNVDTNAFKAQVGLGTTYVTGSTSTSTYSPGGADLNVRSTVDSQGSISKTSNAADFAFDGNGFAVVRTNIDGSGEFLFTRKCDFQPDNQGFLVNSDGFYLYAWRLDADGAIPAANQDISSLIPVNVSSSQGVVNKTTKVNIGMNLDSRTNLGAESIQFTSTTDATELQTKMGEAGAYTKVIQFTLNGAVVATTVTVTETSTLATVTAAINAIAGIDAAMVGNKLIINPTNIQDTVEIKESGGGNAVTKLFGKPTVQQKGFDYSRQVRIFDALGTARDIDFYFKKSNTINVWNVEAYSTDSTLVTPANGLIGTGVFTFDGNGALSSITGTLSTVVSIPWTLATTGVAPQPVNFNFGIDAAGAKTDGSISQFASPFNVNFINPNGAEFGNRTSIAITKEGVITSTYTNGEFTEDYKIAIATFANPNGLSEVSGNVYRATFDSGEYNLREASNGGAGGIVGSSLEKSNVDMATELTKLITINKAYQANTNVITKTNEMLSSLLQAV